MKQKFFTGNFTLLIFGQVSSMFGDNILKFAMSMYVLEVTGSAAIFAGLLAVSMIPTILLSPLGGILADRMNRRNLMVALDLLSGLAILCACLFFSPEHATAIIGALLMILSVLGAFESPTVQACVPQMQTGDNIIRANAVVNQVSALSGLVAPLLGSVLYIMFGLEPILLVSGICFLLTALLECFIKLRAVEQPAGQSIPQIIKSDFLTSMRFIFKEQTNILKVLLLSAAASFFVMGTVMVGLPFTVRNVLGLDAQLYGLAQSALGLTAIIGGISVSFFVTRLKTRHLYLLMALVGVCLIPAGILFLFPVGVMARYFVLVLSACSVQFAACIFSIFALSIIQRQTPDAMLGKIMSYVVAISLCAQPLGQVIYGALFDGLANALYFVFIPSGLMICLIGLSSRRTFSSLENACTPSC